MEKKNTLNRGRGAWVLDVFLCSIGPFVIGGVCDMHLKGSYLKASHRRGKGKEKEMWSSCSTEMGIRVG